MDISVNLDNTGAVSYYEQIYRYIREEIRCGNLKKGEKLPSTRALASSLKVARSTAATAYEQLLSEGYIQTRTGSGTYVCGPENIDDLKMADPDSKTTVAAPGFGEQQFLHGQKACEETDIIDFSPRKIEMSEFPYATWRKILRGLMTGHRAQIFERGDHQGDLELRKTIARYLHFSRGCRCEAENIVVGAGNDYLLTLLFYIYRRPCKTAMENPTYSRAEKIFHASGYEVVPVRMDSGGMVVEDLESSGCSLVYVMPARQYPTGAVMSYTRRTELLAWSNAGDERYIIEDDYDSEFRYRTRPMPALQSYDTNGRVIYMGTFSKSIAPAIRVSYMILPGALLERYHRYCSIFASTVSRIDQSILNEFIRDGYFERYLNRMRKIYRQKHDLMLKCLEPLRKDYYIKGEGAGLHLVLEKKDGSKNKRKYNVEEIIEEEENMAAKLLEKGIKVHPMSHLLIPGMDIPKGQELKPSLILGYASLDLSTIQKGCAVICDMLKS